MFSLEAGLTVEVGNVLLASPKVSGTLVQAVLLRFPPKYTPPEFVWLVNVLVTIMFSHCSCAALFTGFGTFSVLS